MEDTLLTPHDRSRFSKSHGMKQAFPIDIIRAVEASIFFERIN